MVADHYCIPPLERLDVDELLYLIRQKKYFVIHAPRQTGKTSVLLALADLLNASDEFRCLYVNVEGAQTAREDVSRGISSILTTLGSEARTELRDSFVSDKKAEIFESAGPDTALAEVLTQWCEASPSLWYC